MLDFEGSWDQHLSLIEFAYNNNYQSTIQMVPYEALYGRKCRSPVGWFEVGDHPLLGPNMILDAVIKVQSNSKSIEVLRRQQASGTRI